MARPRRTLLTAAAFVLAAHGFPAIVFALLSPRAGNTDTGSWASLDVAPLTRVHQKVAAVILLEPVASSDRVLADDGAFSQES
mmetsp:Transcript_39516/g.113274  ORF Transcript_39516/g.113274 Transcript_39516/m.113274 type:complete len:83 (-) Transcript_39516:53-301(-)